ncbi:MAG: hypothetical protein J5838_03190, partial [Desulfovibrio sp.]|nr:hypothetical protein [Desulfovibrio sp.]
MRIHRLSASFLLCNAIVFCCLLLGAAWGDAIAGPAYRRVLTSDASQTAWQDGLDITLAVDAERCKKAYGANWSRECAAPAPGKIGQVAKGVSMTPAVEGVWRWSGGAQIHFEPKDHLAPDTAYTISLDKLPLPPRFSLSAKNFVYRTQPQAVRVKGKENLWIDPSNKGRHILSVPLQFIWPADKRSAESALRVAAADPRSGLAFGEPAFVWNEACDEVVFNVPVQALPERTSAAILSFSGMPAWHFADGKRVVDASGGSRGAIYKTDFRVAITGKESIMDVKEISISPAYTDELAREYQLVVKTSMQTLPGEVLKFLDLVMLPAKREKSDRVDCDWPSMPAIGASDIARGQKIQARLLQPADEAATEIRMSVPVEAGRGLMAAMRSGLRATAGYSLGKVRRFILKVPSLEPEINFLQPGNILPLGSEQKIDIHSIGVKSIKWRIERIRDPFLALLAQKSGFSRDEECDFSTMGVAEEGSIDVVHGDPGKAAYTALDLSAANGGKGPFHGLMNLTLTGSNGKEQLCQVSRLILVTDLGLMLKTSVDGARTAFVRSLSTGNPVDGAEVRLLGANGLPVISGRTANGGRVDLPPVHGLKREKHPEAVVAVSGDDMAWLSLSESSRQVDYGDFAVSGRHGTSEGLTASVFSQRGLYMPGETLHFACVLRRLDWEPIANAVPLEAVMYGPAGNVVMKRKLSVGKDGLVSLDWKSDEDCATGTYRLDIRLEGENDGGSVVGSATARVEEFQPDTLALKAELSEMTDGWIRTAPGDKVSLKVRLDNLYGEPAVGHRIRVAFRAVPTQLSFPSRHTDLAFVDASPMNGDVQEIAIPDAVTDEKGEAVISLPVEKLRAGTNLGTLSIEGFEKAGGRAVSRSLSACFSPRSVLLGYKPVDGANNLDYIPQASKAGVRIFLFDEKLKPVTDKDISLVLSARRYVTNLVSDAAGNYRY